MSPQRIGPLTILAELGTGPGSRVFHVRPKADLREYALKVTPDGRRAHDGFARQLRNEFRVGKLLDHPGVVKVYGLERQTDWLFRPTQAWLLLEFAAGQTLDAIPSPDIGRLIGIFDRVAEIPRPRP